MNYEPLKLDKMFLWIRDSLKPGNWFPEGEKKLTEDQAIYIERLMEIDYKEMEGVEFNKDFSKIRKHDLTGFKKPVSVTK
jgi:hypothetical protein